MDRRLVDRYSSELEYFRDMGAELAEEFPNIARYLSANATTVKDPYVERLLEGVALLTARVQLELDAQFPRFTQALLDSVYPDYLAPIPSMLIAQFTPKPNDASLSKSGPVPRDTPLFGAVGDDGARACEFRTAHDVTLWPLSVDDASYFRQPPDLPGLSGRVDGELGAGVRILLRTTGGTLFKQLRSPSKESSSGQAADTASSDRGAKDSLPLDHLVFYLGGREAVANSLYERCLGHCRGVAVIVGEGEQRRTHWLGAHAVRPTGFADGQRLLPFTKRSFQGYRLLQEYFAFGPRFRFIEVAGLAAALQAAATATAEILIFFDADATLDRLVKPANFALFCTPAINLFPKRLDRIPLSAAEHEYHVVPEGTRPLDFEVYRITDVQGLAVGTHAEVSFKPFYSATHHDSSGRSAYFTTRREPRVESTTQKRHGPRSNYPGTEVFLSIVDPVKPPFSRELRQLAVQALCTNRDLVFQMGGGFTLGIEAPVSKVQVLAGPTNPTPPTVRDAVSWRAISHLSLNYLSLVNTSAAAGDGPAVSGGSADARRKSAAAGAGSLRELLSLYVSVGDAVGRRQVDAVRSVDVAPTVRRFPSLTPGEPLVFGRGLQVTVDVDETAFEGGSAFIAGSVLSHFFARHVSINSFTETVLRASDGRAIGRWGPQWGARPTL